MGTWGFGLYSNDTTCDFRDSYLNYLDNGLSNDEAFYKVYAELMSSACCKEDEPLFWFALADTQWRWGRLMPNVKEKALEWIDKNEAISWIDSPKGQNKWRETLNKLKARLNSPQRPEKKIQKTKVFDVDPWNLYDIYAYRFDSDEADEAGIRGKYILMQKIGATHLKLYKLDQTCMRVIMIDRIFDEIPRIDELNVENDRLLPTFAPSSICFGDPGARFYTNYDSYLYADLYATNIRQYPKNKLTYIGNKKFSLELWYELANRDHERDFAWNHIEQFAPVWKRWQGKVYDKCSDGHYHRIR